MANSLAVIISDRYIVKDDIKDELNSGNCPKVLCQFFKTLPTIFYKLQNDLVDFIMARYLAVIFDNL